MANCRSPDLLHVFDLGAKGGNFGSELSDGVETLLAEAAIVGRARLALGGSRTG